MEELYPISGLFELLNEIEPLSENFKNLLPGNMLDEEGPFHENKIVLNCGEVSKMAMWMPVGYARAYTELPGAFPGHTKQQTINFWKGGLIVVKDSFFQQQPSTHFLEIAKDSVIRGISFDGLQVMKAKTKEANELIAKILSDDYTEVFNRARLIKLPVRERYMTFLEAFDPLIEQYFELRAIANYLGMDPTTMSNLRSGKY